MYRNPRHSSFDKEKNRIKTRRVVGQNGDNIWKFSKIVFKNRVLFKSNNYGHFKVKVVFILFNKLSEMFNRYFIDKFRSINSRKQSKVLTEKRRLVAAPSILDPGQLTSYLIVYIQILATLFGES